MVLAARTTVSDLLTYLQPLPLRGLTRRQRRRVDHSLKGPLLTHFRQYGAHRRTRRRAHVRLAPLVAGRVLRLGYEGPCVAEPCASRVACDTRSTLLLYPTTLLVVTSPGTRCSRPVRYAAASAHVAASWMLAGRSGLALELGLCTSYKARLVSEEAKEGVTPMPRPQPTYSLLLSYLLRVSCGPAAGSPFRRGRRSLPSSAPSPA